MPTVELAAGTIEDQDTGVGPVVVLLHGLAMNGSLWRHVVRELTLVGNDSGLFLFVTAQCPRRISRLVVTSCEAFENFPPRLPGRAVALAGRLPGGLNALVQPSRLGMLRRLPVVLGWMAKRPVPDDAASRRPPAHAAGVNHVSAATRGPGIAWSSSPRTGSSTSRSRLRPAAEHRAPDDRRG
jgi:hypothetical protein